MHTPGAVRLTASLSHGDWYEVGSTGVNVIAATLVAIAVSSQVTLKVDQVIGRGAVATYGDGSSSDLRVRADGYRETVRSPFGGMVRPSRNQTGSWRSGGGAYAAPHDAAFSRRYRRRR
jgi:hypothetical protein